ncbi:hypothetical protein [Acinetobacter junii]|uniref:hypothetical protein n=1 Tax=Acinetobacter junii TaxID=40215 RepID=UPI001F38D30B|nr:hypothetical protein [Acinetobacter junii]
MHNQRFSITVLSLLSGLMLAACNDSNNDGTSVETSPNQLTDCMWQDGPTSESGSGEDKMNFAYPDSNVYYWSSEFTIPEGAKIHLEGDFPYARHTSLVSYTATGERVNSLRDIEIVPNKGVVNPFIIGNNRMNKKRGFQAEIKLGDLPEIPEKNTLYAPKTDTNKVAVIYRIYVPNKGMDKKAGVSFPRYKVVLANGEIKTGAEVCDVLNVKKSRIQNENVPAAYIPVYNQLKPFFGIGYPARQEPKWFKTFNAEFNFRCIFQFFDDNKPCEGRTPESIMNQWATPDNEYVLAATSRELGKVIMLRGKLPTTTKTYNNDVIVNNSDMRYWSICTNEMYTSATNYCLFDEQIKTDDNGYYTIVVSTSEDKPNNAVQACGYNYLQQSSRGDGYDQAIVGDGHSDLGMLLIRNLLPNDSFKQTVQSVKVSGTEKDIMGDYAPDITYMSKEDFELKGCN